MMKEIKTSSLASSGELDQRKKFFELYKKNPIPSSEQLAAISLYLKRQDLMKVLFFNELYQEIVDTHGIIIEFGCRWGQNLVTLSNLRSIHEPYNYNRKILGFDTFSGFKNTHEKDGQDEIIAEGAFSTTEDYDSYLEGVLEYHESESPLNHIRKFEVIKGDAVVQLEQYLEKHPETIIAFAWFDFDIFDPSFKCLNLIRSHLTKGSIIGFDELNDPKFPGETTALKEALGLTNVRIQRNKYSGMQSYIKFE
jgi:hypothetical protein